MSADQRAVTKEELFQRKDYRRRVLANLPIEEKIKIVVKLQHLASNVGRQAGRAYRKPWDIKLTAHS